MERAAVREKRAAEMAAAVGAGTGAGAQAGAAAEASSSATPATAPATEAANGEEYKGSDDEDEAMPPGARPADLEG